MRKLKLLLVTLAMVVGGASSVWAQASYNHTYTKGVAPVAGGDYFLYNIASGMFLNDGMDYGTHASVDHAGRVITLAGTGTYTIDTKPFSANGSDEKAGKLNLNGSGEPYVDMGSSAEWTFTPVEVAGYENVYTISTGGKYLFYEVKDDLYQGRMGAFVRAGDNTNDTRSYWLIIPMSDRQAVKDYTYLLRNTDFHHPWELMMWSNTVAWTNPAGGKKENACAEMYGKGFDISQTISATVTNGKYILYNQAFYNNADAGNPTYLYANEDKAPIAILNANGEGTAANMAGASEAFTAGKYVNSVATVVTDGKLKVGLKNATTANNAWTIMDNFYLEYLGKVLLNDAVALPNGGAMEADTWYYFDIAVDGSYNLTATTLDNIVYTTDGSILVEDEATVTSKFGANPVALSAGRYFVKSSSAQSLTVAANSFTYEVGAATLSAADGSFTQNSTFTVTFTSAATNDPDAEASLVASSKATVNGNEVPLTAVTNGFSIDLGELSANTDYAIVIPADVYGYTDESMNTAINVTLHTPAVFDGEYVLYDATSKLFLARGGGYGTEAVCDKYGVPFNLKTDATGVSSIEFVDWTGVYLFITGTAIYTDNASTGWKLIPSGSGYKLSNAGQTVYATHSSGPLGEYLHTTDNAENATVWTLKTKTERDEIIAQYPIDNIKNVITASGISTTAGDFKTYLSTNYNANDMTDLIGTATFASAVGSWTWNKVRNQDNQPAYGEGFAEVWNATGSYTQTIGKETLPAGIYKVTVQGYERRKANDASTALYAAGYNLVSTYLAANGEQVRFTDWNEVDGKPTNTGGAVNAFNNGKAVNEVYVYLDGNTDLTITVKKPNYIWDNWAIFNNFTLTYYDQTAVNMSITDAKWATFVAPFDVTIPDGVTAYNVTGISGTTLVKEKVETTIPANKPVLLNSETVVDQTFYGKVVNGTPTNGILTGVYEDVKATVGTYVLQKHGDDVNFYIVASGEEPTVSANRAYLTAPATAKMLSFIDDDDVTIIEGIDAQNSEEYDAIYNAAGIQVKALQKGLNIVVKDGKSYKIYVK